MCEKFTVCQNSMELLLQNNLNLPKVTEEDGCLLAGFNEARNRCLLSGLILYTWGKFCLLKRTVEVDLKICAGSGQTSTLYKHHLLTCTEH